MIIEIIPNELVFVKEDGNWQAKNYRLNKKLDIKKESNIKMLEDISQYGDIVVDNISSDDWILYVQILLITMLTNSEKGEE